MKTKKVGIRKGNSFSLDKKNMRKSLKELIVSYLTNDYRSTKLGYCFSCVVIALGALLASTTISK